MSNRTTKTEQIEMVETHNLSLALKRLAGAPYVSGRWKRALYHALAMEGCCSFQELKGIREALGLA